jgi:hypothetical protein
VEIILVTKVEQSKMQPLQIKPQIELLGEEVRIVNSKVGTKTIGCCTSWITKTIVEQLGA